MMNRLAAVMVVMVMGLTAFGAKAGATPDNLTVEVRVSIASVIDIQWTAATSTTDTASWVITNPNLGDIKKSAAAVTGDGSAAGANVQLVAQGFAVENVGNRKVDLSIVVANQDSTGNAGFKWTNKGSAPTSAAADNSKYHLKFKGGTVATYTSFAAGTGAATKLDFADSFKRNATPIALAFEYYLPVEVNSENDEFDVAHTTVLTVTANPD